VGEEVQDEEDGEENKEYGAVEEQGRLFASYLENIGREVRFASSEKNDGCVFREKTLTKKRPGGAFI
jgi:hypothetical protein